EALAPLLDKGLPLAALDGMPDAAALETTPIDVVAMTGDGEAMGAVRRALAAREGAIAGFVTERLNPAAYAHERAVCVDTTAAGGNATLLASAG
ncbi:MAG: hypothetical protein KDK08_10235, partial [Rhizobiaceae bacterium]|nr:hypothetical protein [Rhizobiaceae bacterium]